MKSKILLSGLVLLLMASLAPALSSCTSKTTTTASSTTNVTSVTTTNANAPVYGGTLTVMTDWVTPIRQVLMPTSVPPCGQLPFGMHHSFRGYLAATSTVMGLVVPTHSRFNRPSISRRSTWAGMTS